MTINTIKLQKQIKCLREQLDAIEITIGSGSNLGGLTSECKTAKKEPTQAQRVKNYADVLNTPHKKPKHLKKL